MKVANISNKNQDPIKRIIAQLSAKANLTNQEINRIFIRNPLKDRNVISKAKLLAAYKQLGLKPNDNFMSNIKMKAIRTLSGVTTVTVLTKPFPCPGRCIFCPNDVNMPKSYISSEPGAQRAASNGFDPYTQVLNRLTALRNIGHPTQKAELIVLGGTWTSYPQKYQLWFIKRCFDALNKFGDKTYDSSTNVVLSAVNEEIHKKDGGVEYNLSVLQNVRARPAATESANRSELFDAHTKNETSKVRCVGLVIETRPDEITQAQVIKLRKLGVTKIQLGVQSLDDGVLRLNKRDHTVAQTVKAFSLLRAAGFKIHAHWMPNLYGSSPKKDIAGIKKLFTAQKFKPDELKIYPCSLIKGTELAKIYNQGLWKPYDYDTLLYVLTESLKIVPGYCRVTRVLRDIPSSEILAGNKLTNFRQNVEKELKRQKFIIQEIRNREIKDTKIKPGELKMRQTAYKTLSSKEVFLEYVNKEDRLAGLLRLSLPTTTPFIKELEGCAIIREVHVYGQSLQLGSKGLSASQHAGLGYKLVTQSIAITRKNGYSKIAVISAVGTRKYYEKFGFNQEELYQVLDISERKYPKKH